MADNPFGDEGGMRLTEVLCDDNSTLQILDLHGTQMNKGLERKLVEELHQKSHLKKLGSAFGKKPTTEDQKLSNSDEIARRHAREEQARWFQQQASGSHTHGEYLL